MVKITIQGVVQGVGYRYFVLENALRYNINGTVRNIDNGAVEIYADYSDSTTEESVKFISALKSGPPASSVENVIITTVDTEKMTKGFKILR